MITLVREARRWWRAGIANEGDILDMVIETPQDLERVKFKWTGVHYDMGNDGLTGPLSEVTNS